MGVLEYVDRLGAAGAQMAWTEMAAISNEVVADVHDDPNAARAWSTKDVGKLLGELRKKRRFEEMEAIADALLTAGRDDFIVQRQRVQALVDQGDVEYAFDSVRELAAAIADRPDHPEYAEACGLLGRVLRQSYVDARRPGRSACRHLGEAIQAYLRVYRTGEEEHHWHGINVVACLARAERDGVDVGCQEDWRQIAEDIQAGIDYLYERDPDNDYNMWAWASAMEASVALDDFLEAGKWLNRYLGSACIDAFELYSTHRQLVEVWQLGTSGGDGSQLLLPLRGTLLSKTGGQVDLAEDDDFARPDEQLQATWGDETVRGADWWDEVTACMKPVARVERRSGSSVGTAYVVDAGDLCDNWAGKSVALTAAHVVSDPPDLKGISSAEARLNFTRHRSQRGADRAEVEVLWTDSKLDVSVLRLKGGLAETGTIGLAGTRKYQAAAGQRERLFVIGHPEGRGLSVSLYDNFLDSIEAPRVFYRSPTEGGSSGAPVLDEEQKSLAIHRAASTKRKLNVGVLIDSVREAVCRSAAAKNQL